MISRRKSRSQTPRSRATHFASSELPRLRQFSTVVQERDLTVRERVLREVSGSPDEAALIALVGEAAEFVTQIQTMTAWSDEQVLRAIGCSDERLQRKSVSIETVKPALVLLSRLRDAVAVVYEVARDSRATGEAFAADDERALREFRDGDATGAIGYAMAHPRVFLEQPAGSADWIKAR